MTAAKKLSPDPAQVKRILVYSNRKADPIYFDASTEELEAGAFLALFELLDESWQCYVNLKEEEKPYYKRPEGHVDGCLCNECKAFRKEDKEVPKREAERLEQFAFYTAAKKGEALAARRLLELRKDYEYEEFSFDFVKSATSCYPPRVWGVTKPCEEAFVSENGVYKWAVHGRIETPELRAASGNYGYRPTVKEALEYLTKTGPMKLDIKTKETVDLGDEVWKFRARGKDKEGKTWDDSEWMYRGLCSENEYAKTGIPILEQGSMKPGKVIRLTGQTCGGCRRDMERFNKR